MCCFYGIKYCSKQKLFNQKLLNKTRCLEWDLKSYVRTSAEYGCAVKYSYSGRHTGNNIVTNATESVLSSLQSSWEMFVYFILFKHVPVCHKHSKNILQMFLLSYKKVISKCFLNIQNKLRKHSILYCKHYGTLLLNVL